MGPNFMKTITVGSKVEVTGTAEKSIGKVLQMDPEGIAIVELKTKVVACLAAELILIK